jgi:hypothetical protein
VDAKHWHWFQFRSYEGKTPAMDRWAIAHLYPADAAGDPAGALPLCSVWPSSFKPWDRLRVVRLAPAGSRPCKNCSRLLQHARDEHGGDLAQVADPANWRPGGRWASRPRPQRLDSRL